MHNIPSGWAEVKFEDVIELNPPKFVDLDANENVTFVPMAAVSEVSGTIVNGVIRPLIEVNRGFTQFNEKDVIFAKISPSMENGKSAIATGLASGVGFGSTEFHVLRCSGAVLPEYVWRFVRQESFRENAQKVMSGAVGQQRVPISYLKNHLLPLPPLNEQKEIVSKIATLTERTARARSALEKIPGLVDQYKKSILFAAFRNITGKATTLGALAEFITSGSRGWAQYYSDSGSLFLRVGNTQRSSINLDLTDKQYVRPPGGAEGMRTQVKNDDILVTITADLGRIALVPKDLEDAYVNQHIALVRLKQPDTAKFISWFLVSPQGQARLQENNRGTTRAGLGLNDIRNLKLTLPGLVQQDEIIRQIETTFDWLDNVITSQKIAIKLINNLDISSLSKGFRGELTIQNPSDESATALLGRIQVESSTKLKQVKIKKKVTRVPAMNIDVKARVLEDSLSWPENGLRFDEILKRISLPYDVVRDAIFSLLGDKNPIIKQFFDKNDECMHLMRVSE